MQPLLKAVPLQLGEYISLHKDHPSTMLFTVIDKSNLAVRVLLKMIWLNDVSNEYHFILIVLRLTS